MGTKFALAARSVDLKVSGSIIYLSASELCCVYRMPQYNLSMHQHGSSSALPLIPACVAVRGNNSNTILDEPVVAFVGAS